MKHLVIKNIGPLKKAEIEIGNINMIIGTQSSGKSCVLKMACYCSWVEKRLMLTRYNDSSFPDAEFINDFVEYYRMDGYIKENSFVSYESPYLTFTYDNRYKNNKFKYSFKSNYWRFARPVISYIPSDRNIVSVFSNYDKMSDISNCLQDYAKQWDSARNVFGQSNILNLDLKYHYDKKKKRDIVTNIDGSEVDLNSTSSGVQSMFPLYILINYLTDSIYKEKYSCVTGLSISNEMEYNMLLDYIYSKIVSSSQSRAFKYSCKIRINSKSIIYSFANDKDREKFQGYVDKLLFNDHTELYVEEPENNIFPPTQTKLIRWMLDRITKSDRDDTLFLATHSPYVLTEMLADPKQDVKLFFTYTKKGNTYVKTASPDDIQDIYDNGVDMFFNFEAFI